MKNIGPMYILCKGVQFIQNFVDSERLSTPLKLELYSVPMRFNPFTARCLHVGFGQIPFDRQEHII